MTPTTRFFLAIRHRPSGGFLPAMSSYGFTRCEPSTTEAPRLFSKHGPARQALDRWLKGEWIEGLFNEDTGQQNIKILPRADRKASEMEIVEIEIIARSLEDSKLRIL